MKDIVTEPTPQEILEAAKESDLAAINMSIRCWLWKRDATEEELEKHYYQKEFGACRDIRSCALCTRSMYLTRCFCRVECCLCDNSQRKCCKEWEKVNGVAVTTPAYKKAVDELLARLYKERDKLMSKEKMHEIEGLGDKAVSDSTITEALKEHFSEKEKKPYEFQAGDICLTRPNHQKRLILKIDGKLRAFDVKDGECMARGQREFEECGYRKIGVISDFIK